MKIFEGVVVSTAMGNTVVVEVSRKTPHPLYRKLIKRSKKYKVDSTGNSVEVGNRVKIAETRPISKDKHFKIHEVLKKTEAIKKAPALKTKVRAKKKEDSKNGSA